MESATQEGLPEEVTAEWWVKVAEERVMKCLGKGRQHSECKGSEGTCLLCSRNSKEAGMHREWGWEEQLRGTLRLRKGEKTRLAWLRGVSDKTWRGKLAFPVCPAKYGHFHSRQSSATAKPDTVS